MSDALPAVFAGHLPLSYGVLEICVGLACIHSGMTIVQTGSYLRTCSRDPAALRILVLFICGVDLVQTALLMHTIYFYTITSFGNSQALVRMILSMQVSLLFVGVSTFTVRTYFCAVRVYRLTVSVMASLACWLPALLAAGLELSLFITLFISASWEIAYTNSFKWRMATMLIMSAVADVLIAGSICWNLYGMRSGFTPSDKLVDKLIKCTIGSGLITSVASVIAVTVYLAKESFVFVAFYILIAKIANNSLLASLNERTQNRRQLMEPSSVMITRLVTFEQEEGVHPVTTYAGNRPKSDTLSDLDLREDVV